MADFRTVSSAPVDRYGSDELLRHYHDAPQLPSGYFGMFLLVYVPPLWRKVMDPKVLEWANGDMSRVNVETCHLGNCPCR